MRLRVVAFLLVVFVALLWLVLPEPGPGPSASPAQAAAPTAAAATATAAPAHAAPTAADETIVAGPQLDGQDDAPTPSPALADTTAIATPGSKPLPCLTPEQRALPIAQRAPLLVRHIQGPHWQQITEPENKYPLVREYGRMRMVADHLMVRVPPGSSPEQVAQHAAAAGYNLRRRVIPKGDLYLISFPSADAQALPRAYLELAQQDWIVNIEPDWIVQAAKTPDDPSLVDAKLWGMHNTGQRVAFTAIAGLQGSYNQAGVVDADIDAPEAWELSTGSRNVLVGIIDQGVDRTHPDLINNMWINPGEIAGNGRDDDNNGYVDDVYGWDFVDDDKEPKPTSPTENHGTHVAGTIGAEGNNGLGVVGVNWQVTMVSLRGLGPKDGKNSDLMAALAYASAIGCKVANHSYGGGGVADMATEWNNLFEQTGAKGLISIAAAGNEETNNDIFSHYPSSFSSDAIVSVAASDNRDQIADFSNYGRESVDIFAPGWAILSTVNQLSGHDYLAWDGTSMATPMVAGVAALLLSKEPNLSVPEIKQRLLANVDPVGDAIARTVSGGRLNAYRTLAPPSGGEPQLRIFSDRGAHANGSTVVFAQALQMDVENQATPLVLWNNGEGPLTFSDPAMTVESTTNCTLELGESLTTLGARTRLSPVLRVRPSDFTWTARVTFHSNSNPQAYTVQINGVATVSRPTVTSPATATGDMGAEFSYQIQSLPSARSYSISGFPRGLSVDPSSGLIRGRPRESGSFTGQVRATNLAGSGIRTVAVTITDLLPRFTMLEDQILWLNEAASFTVGARGATDYMYSATGLPSGLSIDPSTGVISGVPTALGSFKVTVFATSGSLVVDDYFQVLVQSGMRVNWAVVDVDALGVSGVVITRSTVGDAEDGVVRVTREDGIADAIDANPADEGPAEAFPPELTTESQVFHLQVDVGGEG